MRKYQTPTESLINNPKWLATMNFVESMLYPLSDPGLLRNSGTISDINYRMVYETVFFGNDKIPGLYSQVVSPPDGGPGTSAQTPVPAAPEIPAARRNILPRDRAVVGPETLGPPAPPTSASVRPAAATTSATTAPATSGRTPSPLNPFGTEEERFVGSTGQATPSPTADWATQVLQPSTAQSPVLPTIMASGAAALQTSLQTSTISQQRITDLANALVRQVQQQRVAEIPLGFKPSDVNPVVTKRLAEIVRKKDVIEKQLEGLEAASPRHLELVEQLKKLSDDEMLERAGRNDGMEYMFIPGKGPVGKVDSVVIDYAKRIPLDPSKFTVDAIRFDAKMIAEMKKYPGAQPDVDNFISENDVGPTLRQYAREGKLQDLYSRLSQVDPNWDDRKVLDFNGIDEYTSDRFEKFAYSAQNQGLTVEQYLDQLMNDPDQISRVQRERRNSGGSGVTIRLPSDDDLTSVFKYVSQATIGRTLPKEVYQSMIDAYKPQLVRFQQQLQGGGTVTEPPQAETFAEGQIKEQFGQEAFTYKMGGFLDRLSQIGGSGV
jgi:hypothetical protein